MTLNASLIHDPPSISPDHEVELRRFMLLGGSVGERSSAGPMLERARLYAVRSFPCANCGGDVKRHKAGRGTVWPRQSAEERAKALAHEKAVAEFLGLDPEDEAALDPGLHGAECPVCEGRGWVVDNRPNHMAPEPDPRDGGVLWARGAVHLCGPIEPKPSAEPSCSRDEVAEHELLALLGVVSRRLLAVGEKHADVLRAYYLPSPVHESPRAVWPLTPAGKTMLKASHRNVGPWQAIDELLTAQAERPTAKRRQQFEAANKQAEELLRAARAAWTGVVAKETELAVDAFLGGGQ